MCPITILCCAIKLPTMLSKELLLVKLRQWFVDTGIGTHILGLLVTVGLLWEEVKEPASLGALLHVAACQCFLESWAHKTHHLAKGGRKVRVLFCSRLLGPFVWFLAKFGCPVGLVNLSDATGCQMHPSVPLRASNSAPSTQPSLLGKRC